MKQKFFLLAFLALLLLDVSAQVDSTFTLKKCIDYALQNAPNLKNSKLDEYIAQAQIGQVRASGLPQINAEASIVHNPTLPRMFLKGDNQFLQDTSGKFNPDPNEVYAIPNFFQLKSSGDAKATINQVIFSSSLLVGLQAAKSFKELASKSSQSTQIQVIEAVKKAYYATLINQERLKYLDNNILRVDTLLRQTKAMQAGGFAENIDVMRIEVTYNNLITERQKFLNLYSLSFYLLKFQMGMPVNDKLEVQGTIADLDATIATINSQQNLDITKRVEYSLLQTQKRINLLQLKNVRSGYLPTLAAFGTVGASRMDYNLTRVITNSWYHYTLFGLSFSLPIFDGFLKSHQAQQAKLEIQKTENNLFNTKNSIELDAQQSQFALKNNMQTLESQKRNLDLSTEVARVSKLKYQAGIGSNIEVVTAEGALRESQTNYYNSLYDVIISNVDYQRSLGILTNE